MVAEKQFVLTQLRRLEREYNRIAQNPPDRSHLDALGRFLGWLDGRKPPFRPGDDVWTRMEERTRLFVEEMSGRSWSARTRKQLSNFWRLSGNACNELEKHNPCELVEIISKSYENNVEMWKKTLILTIVQRGIDHTGVDEKDEIPKEKKKWKLIVKKCESNCSKLPESRFVGVARFHLTPGRQLFFLASSSCHIVSFFRLDSPKSIGTTVMVVI